jgi:hypothetical protein
VLLLLLLFYIPTKPVNLPIDRTDEHLFVCFSAFLFLPGKHQDFVVGCCCCCGTSCCVLPAETTLLMRDDMTMIPGSMGWRFWGWVVRFM